MDHTKSGSVMVLGFFAASGAGQLAIIDVNMNSPLYQKILMDNVHPSVQLDYKTGQ